MNSYQLRTPGTLRTVYRDLSGNVFYDTGNTVSGGEFYQLAIGTQSTGDRVNACPQAYFTQRETSWEGSMRQVDGIIIDEEGSWNFGPTPVGISDLETHLYNTCLSRMFDRIRGEIDLAVDVAQAGQTIGMMRGAAKVVSFAGDLVRSVRSRRPIGEISRFLARTGRRFDSTKTVGSLWLEYQYGWRPLVQTVYDCANRLVEPSLTDRWPLLVLKTRAKEREPLTLKRPAPYFPPFKERIDSLAIHRGEMVAQWRIPPSRLLDFSRWTSLNPAGIAWELMPYSFVVDWFIDVGGWIRNLESAMLFQSAFVRGYYTYTCQHEMNGSISEQIGQSYASMSSYRILRKKNRAVLTNVFPKTPVFRPKLGPERLLSAAGLLSGFLGRKP